MGKFRNFFHKKRAIIISLILIGAKKVFDYGAPPRKERDGEKECNFISLNAVDQNRTATMIKAAPEYSISLEQKGEAINDASCLNKTANYGIVKISSVEDVKNALLLAQKNNLKLTSAGQRHSVGGQSFIQNGLVLDMRNFNKITLNPTHKILNTQTGATWAQIQQFLDKRGLAIKAMQSINIFTVGGTLSVNAHGIAHNPGPIASTVKSFRIMLSNGEIKTASSSENQELFQSALGGYGLFGVILDAKIEVVDNEMCDYKTEYIDYKDFPKYYKESIENNDQIGLAYARISVSPRSYLTETAAHTCIKTNFKGHIPALKLAEPSWLYRLIINLSKTGGFGRWIRWMLEKYVAPSLHTCSLNQTINQQKVCLVSRNQEMYDPMDYLKNKLQDTDILQEYFIPPDKMPHFVDGLRDIVQKKRSKSSEYHHSHCA